MGGITLTSGEIRQGALVGVMRQVENFEKGRRDAFGAERDRGWQYAIEGALGEMAFAKWLNVYWHGAHTFRADDVTGRWEVRTRSKHSYDLIVHPEDPDWKRVVLLTGLNGTYYVRGEILAGDAKRPEWWKDPTEKNRYAYFVPRCMLTPVEPGPGVFQDNQHERKTR